jgi:hypothetical protein
MEKKKQVRTSSVKFLLTTGEFVRLEKNWKKTTIRKRSEYLRRLIFNKSITCLVRNQSLDEFMVEMVRLRKELNAIGVNFNQTVHQLHTLDDVPRMRSWLQAFNKDKNVLFGKIDEIKMRINAMSDLWLQ